MMTFWSLSVDWKMQRKLEKMHGRDGYWSMKKGWSKCEKREKINGDRENNYTRNAFSPCFCPFLNS